MPETITYLVLAEVAERLGQSRNTMKSWDQQGLLPQPDATFGHGDGGYVVRAWREDRVVALLGADEAAKIGYDWKVTPEHYLTVAGVAKLLRRPPSTVKWWASSRTNGSPGSASMPAPDARAGRSVGWREHTVLEWFRDGVGQQPRTTGRRVQVLVEGGSSGSLAGALVTVFETLAGARRELARRYRNAPGGDVALSDFEASERYLASQDGRVALRETVVYR